MTKFGEAFKAARSAGKKEFTFGGKKYNTKTKEEAAAPKPRARDDRPKAKTGITKGGNTGDKTKPKVGITKGGNTGDKTKKVSTSSADAKIKADAAREDRIKKSKGLASNIAYAKRVTGRTAGNTWK